MHIVLSVLGVIVTLLVLLKRLADAGIDLGGLNPFLWNRRRDWRNRYEADPIFSVSDPMEATAILMVAVAKADGDMTKEDKSLLLKLFEKEFKLSEKQAASLLVSSAHLLSDGHAVNKNLEKFFESSKENFTIDQLESAYYLVLQVAGEDASMHPSVKELLERIKALFGFQGDSIE